MKLNKRIARHEAMLGYVRPSVRPCAEPLEWMRRRGDVLPSRYINRSIDNSSQPIVGCIVKRRLTFNASKKESETNLHAKRKRQYKKVNCDHKRKSERRGSGYVTPKNAKRGVREG
jgi:hypothetical protein